MIAGLGRVRGRRALPAAAAAVEFIGVLGFWGKGKGDKNQARLWEWGLIYNFLFWCFFRKGPDFDRFCREGSNRRNFPT